jgi:uncharacterized protein (TIGR00299 family) protein
MKILYFDCFAGISGDMVLGALVDAGVSLVDLRAELGKLHVSGWEIRAEKVMKKALSATQIHVETTEGHVHRGLSDITKIIRDSELDESIKKQSITAFTRLAEVEAAIHNKTVEQIHFHEVGALDAIIDIVGAMIGIHLLGIGRIISSPVHLGTGFVKAAHGEIPVPAPATITLLQGVPVYSQGIEAELTTPTGAAILTTLAEEYGPLPPMKVEAIGYGAGRCDLPIPNLLRAFLGTAAAEGYDEDTVQFIETNIDNMNPEFFEHVIERLFAAGALDVWTTPIVMKKSRPAVMLSVLAGPTEAARLTEIILTETTTLGVRTREVRRAKLAREVLAVRTEYGEIHIKIGKLGGKIVNFAPEYDDCKKAADSSGRPLKEIHDAARHAARLALRLPQ